MRLVLAFVAATAFMLLAGCGGSSAKDDPFIGTWRLVGATDASGSLVIAKGPSGYEAFFVGKPLTTGPLPLQRHGNQLVFPAQNGVEGQMFEYQPSTGRLTDKNAAAVGIDFELASRSTSHPTPQPQNPSPDQSSF